MATGSGRGRAPGLTDRRSACCVLARLVAAVRAGESQALVVRGEPGVGKTVLLEYLAGRASESGCRVARHRCPVGDGAGVRRAASAVRSDAGSCRATAASATGGAAYRVGAE